MNKVRSIFRLETGTYLVLWMRTKLTDIIMGKKLRRNCKLWKFQWIFYMHSQCLVNESWLSFHNQQYFGSYRVSAIYGDNHEIIIGYSIFFHIAQHYWVQNKNTAVREGTLSNTKLLYISRSKRKWQNNSYCI